jgi:hypothetical protein
MTAEELVAQVEQRGGTLTVHGDRIVYELPQEAVHLVEDLKVNRDAVLDLLRRRCWHCQGESTCSCIACWKNGRAACVVCKGTGQRHGWIQ